MLLGGGGGGASYARASASGICVFFRSQNTSAYIIQPMQWYMAEEIWQYDWQDTNIEKKAMNMRAGLYNFCIKLLILKLFFPSISCWYYRYLVSETYIFRSPITSAYNKCSFLLLLIVCHYIYKRQSADKTLTLRKIYVCEWTELASLDNFAFSHSKTAISFNIWLVLQKLCRYKGHTCRLTCTCTDRFPNVPTKLRKSMGNCPPPPPPGTYASDLKSKTGYYTPRIIIIKVKQKIIDNNFRFEITER